MYAIKSARPQPAGNRRGSRHPFARTAVLIGLNIVSFVAVACGVATSDEVASVVKTRQSGVWSDLSTWEGNTLPEPGQSVKIRPGHHVIYDISTKAPFRAIHVGGQLEFSSEVSTRLDCGLIRIQDGEELREDGFDCELHDTNPESTSSQATLLVGSPVRAIPASCQALIRLHPIPGLDEKSFPAIVCCGGRMDLHGAPMNRTWMKLANTVEPDASEIELADAVTGWRPGDRILVVSTARIFLFGEGRQLIPTTRDATQSEERTIRAIFRNKIVLDRPLEHRHLGSGENRGEVANLSRNVIVESAEPAGVRGHTMYHRGSKGSISFAEFRHLGKKDVLGRYSLHFHLCRDSMRGSSVIGASIHDSDNRWLTVHGTDFLIIRDCVGYNSIGHGFFLEDGTEVFNVFDRNLAVQARHGRPLPKQVLPFDENEGAGFWWSNCLNSFTRNVAAECDQYGYRFEAAEAPDFSPEQSVPQPDGSLRKVDIRKLPFVRFDDNEAHTHRRFALNLGGIRHVSDEADYQEVRNFRASGKADLSRVQGGHVNGIGPDFRHPFVIRNFRVWNSQWAFHGGSPNVLIDGLYAADCTYGIFKTRTDGHEYRRLEMQRIDTAMIFQPWSSSNVEENYFRYVDDAADDLPPTTVITGCKLVAPNRLHVTGTTSDNRHVRSVRLNANDVTPLREDFAEWEAFVELSPANDELAISVAATDAAGNTEPRPHSIRWTRLGRSHLQAGEPSHASAIIE